VQPHVVRAQPAPTPNVFDGCSSPLRRS
jgi:hypothetical protein